MEILSVDASFRMYHKSWHNAYKHTNCLWMKSLFTEKFGLIILELFTFTYVSQRQALVWST
jgi:hypothetical protein